MKIFLSSTYTDLAAYREAVLDVLTGCEITYKGMEFFGASEHNSLTTCLKQLEDSDRVIALIGTRYGSLSSDTMKSFTEHEIDRACELKKPLMVYFMDEDRQPILKKFVETGDSAQKLESLKERLRKLLNVETFTTLRIWL
jgi:hypothetical protein